MSGVGVASEELVTYGSKEIVCLRETAKSWNTIIWKKSGVGIFVLSNEGFSADSEYKHYVIGKNVFKKVMGQNPVLK